jgi:hypothetical protein
VRAAVAVPEPASRQVDAEPSFHRHCDFPAEASPCLIVVVDTEEAFDWSAPLDRANRAVGHMASIHRVQDIFDSLGVVPCYLVSYPIVSQVVGFRPLQALLASGRAIVGAHLNPWVTPPHLERTDRVNSYPGNLPPELEAAKLAMLATQIERALGIRPTLYRAGRHGKGPNTEAILEEQGFEIDFSPAPPMDYRGDGGPDYRHHSARPFIFGQSRRLLCLPTTGTFVGGLSGFGPVLHPLIEHAALARLRPVAIASRLRLIERLRLSPEGFTLAEMMRLTRALLARGQRTFVLSFHSPSVEPGNTPYVRNDADLNALLERLRQYLTRFGDELDGRFANPDDLKAELEALTPR